MKVLVVHDRQQVANEIHAIVRAELERVDSCVVVSNYQDARTHLSADFYDLLIVDLTIPISAHVGAPGFEAAHALLEELFNAGTLNPPSDVIGITRDTDALALVENHLGPHLMVTIREDDHGKWRSYLKDKATYALRAERKRAVARSQYYDCDALILTAMDVEMEPYGNIFDFTPIRHFRSANEFVFADKDGQPRRGIAYSIGRSGQPSAASLAQALITFFRPKLALMSGYCGGVQEKVNLGDLVFFEAAYAWDYGKWEDNAQDPTQAIFRARPDPIGIIDEPLHEAARRYVLSDYSKAPEILAKVRELSKDKLQSFLLHVKPAASGSAVVAADSIVSRIRGLNDSMWAVDMEAYGFYHAAKHTRVAKPHFLCAKSVSDFSNGEKGDDLHAACSFISAELMIRIMTRDWNFES